MKIYRAGLALAGVWLATGAAAADDSFQAVSGGKLIETLLGLGLVLALIFILARVLQRMQGSVGGQAFFNDPARNTLAIASRR